MSHSYKTRSIIYGHVPFLESKAALTHVSIVGRDRIMVTMSCLIVVASILSQVSGNTSVASSPNFLELTFLSCILRNFFHCLHHCALQYVIRRYGHDKNPRYPKKKIKKIAPAKIPRKSSSKIDSQEEEWNVSVVRNNHGELKLVKPNQPTKFSQAEPGVTEEVLKPDHFITRKFKRMFLESDNGYDSRINLYDKMYQLFVRLYEVVTNGTGLYLIFVYRNDMYNRNLAK